MSSDLAWRQRVTQEDRKLLAQVIEARQRLATESPPQRHTVSTATNDPVLVKRKLNVAAPLASTVRGNRSGSTVSSVAPSCLSSTSTQPSHRGASTVQGSVAISQLTAFSSRLEKLEQRLADEHKERMRVVDELAQIKQLLQQQQFKR